MDDNALFSVAIDNSSFDNEGLEVLPLITKERTQRFELLLHLIPNLKQHIILLGESGIGKTLLLDMLYDINSEVWQCCFIQGSAELSFENVEAQLSKTMLRNKHESLDSALQMFREQHKKIVLIIDDAGLLVSGLITTLIEYAASQNVIKLIFSLTPDARNNHRKTDKVLDDCYMLELPALSKRQSAFFLRQLAAKPRTYAAMPIDEKLLDKIYFKTNGIPAKLIAEFTSLSRKSGNETTKWVLGFTAVVFLAVLINQGVHHFMNKDSSSEEIASSPMPQIETTTDVQIEKNTESATKLEQDIVIPEFKLDIEQKMTVTPSQPVTTQQQPETTTTSTEKESESTDITKAPQTEKSSETTPETQTKIEEPTPPVVESTLPELKKIEDKPEVVAPPKVEPEKIVEPVIAFPKIAPAQGMKIQPLPERSTIKAVPISTPKVEKIHIESVKHVAIKEIEKTAPVKKPVIEKIEVTRIQPVKKIELKTTTPAIKPENIVTKTEPVISAETKRYALQLITLSSDAAVEAFQKKHANIAKNMRVVKSGTAEQPRFGLIYGGFSNTEDAAKAREKLPPEFANALPRKMNP